VRSCDELIRNDRPATIAPAGPTKPSTSKVATIAERHSLSCSIIGGDRTQAAVNGHPSQNCTRSTTVSVLAEETKVQQVKYQHVVKLVGISDDCSGRDELACRLLSLRFLPLRVGRESPPASGREVAVADEPLVVLLDHGRWRQAELRRAVVGNMPTTSVPRLSVAANCPH
jgi:hypothetical protein